MHNVRVFSFNLLRFFLSEKQSTGLGAIRDAQNAPPVEEPMIVN